MTLDYTAHLRSDGEKMAVAVARDLDAHVPSCPEWDAAKLTIHTGGHHRWVADAVRKRGERPGDPGKPGLRGDELVEWFRQGWRDLASLLDATDDDAPAWSWAGDNRAGFWRRRTALETLVHRWDAENATGRPTPLDPALSADGIDEMLFVMLAQHGAAYRGQRVHLAMTPPDAEGAWTLDLEDGKPPRAGRGRRDAPVPETVTLDVPAEKILLFLWGRHAADAAGLEGEPADVAALVRWVSE